VLVLLKIELGIFGTVGFFVYIHGSPLGSRLIRQMAVQPIIGMSANKLSATSASIKSANVGISADQHVHA
jgi:hypothetical protein